MVVRNGSMPVSPQRRLVAWRQFAAGKAGHSRAGSARASSEVGRGEARRLKVRQRGPAIEVTAEAETTTPVRQRPRRVSAGPVQL